MTTNLSQHRRDNKIIPLYFVAFFVFLALLNIIFFYIATSTHRGVITDNAYEKGLKYNDVIEKSEQQALLGWQGDIIFDDVGNMLTFRLKDKNNLPIGGAVVKAYLTFIASEGHDFDVMLPPTDISGIYQAPLAFPRGGQWNIHIYVSDETANYQVKKWVVVKQ